MCRAALVLAVALATHAAVAQDEACRFTGPSGSSYDLTPLYRPSGDDYTKTIQVGPNIQFIYRLNVCGNTNNRCQSQDAPATEALRIPAGETCRILGRLEGAKYEESSVPPSASNPDGAAVSITYGNGDICDPTARTTRSVTLNVQCSTVEVEDVRITEVKKEGTCSTTFNLVSKHACPASGGGRFKTLLIISFIIFGVYMALGYAWNYKQGARGIEAVPHLDFWRDLPSLVQEGCRYSYFKAQDLKERFKSRGSGGDNF